jgi:hypothetical protein
VNYKFVGIARPHFFRAKITLNAACGRLKPQARHTLKHMKKYLIDRKQYFTDEF